MNWLQAALGLRPSVQRFLVNRSIHSQHVCKRGKEVHLRRQRVPVPPKPPVRRPLRQCRHLLQVFLSAVDMLERNNSTEGWDRCFEVTGFRVTRGRNQDETQSPEPRKFQVSGPQPYEKNPRNSEAPGPIIQDSKMQDSKM